jgi:UDP-N-acetylglucosamine 2-epimerase (non-hydrolysing)
VIRVLSVFGTRPEAIKMAPVVNTLAARPTEFESLVCLTGQHRDMLDQVMDCFALRADCDLDLMRPDQSPAEVASRVLAELPGVLRRARPNVVLVQGDTMTTFAASLAAFLHRVPVGHVEAGLRTGNFEQPFPEEMNRVLTTRVVSVHFPPTETAELALRREGIPAPSIVRTGNTVIDALLLTVDAGYCFKERALAGRDERRPLVLVTIHRRESFGPPLRSLCSAVRQLAEKLREHDFVLPVHRNPHVRETIHTHLHGYKNVLLTEPLEYREFVNVMARSRLILTDSGGIQEEAPSLNVPVLVLRQVTERPEGVAAGAARVVGTDVATIVNAVESLFADSAAYQRMAGVENPYGDGRAAERIAQTLIERFGD